MNNYHFLSPKLINKSFIALLLSVAVLSPSVAQQATQPSFSDVSVQRDVLGGASNQTSFVLPEGASLSDTNKKLQELSTEGARSLQDLVGDAVSNDREKNDIEARSRDAREIEQLETSLKKAKLAKELYQELNGEEDNLQAELDAVKAERDAFASQLSTIEEELIKTRKLYVETAITASTANPVVVSIVGSAGNLSAKLLVPNTGQITVKQGDVLSNGQRVSSITYQGVTVSKEGSPDIKLSFGTSVSSR